MAKHGLTYDLLTDRGNRVAGQFGIAFTLAEELRPIYRKFNSDLTVYNGDDSWTLPLPGQFIIDQSSIIRYSNVNVDYTSRPEPSETAAELRALRAGPTARSE